MFLRSIIPELAEGRRRGFRLAPPQALAGNGKKEKRIEFPM